MVKSGRRTKPLNFSETSKPHAMEARLLPVYCISLRVSAFLGWTSGTGRTYNRTGRFDDEFNSFRDERKLDRWVSIPTQLAAASKDC